MTEDVFLAAMAWARRMWHRRCGTDGTRCPTSGECEAFDVGFGAGVAATEAPGAIAPPTQDEVAAYRDLFRVELDKNMHNSSGSPSTDAHTVALHRFVSARNEKGSR